MDLPGKVHSQVRIPASSALNQGLSGWSFLNLQPGTAAPKQKVALFSAMRGIKHCYNVTPHTTLHSNQQASAANAAQAVPHDEE